MNDIPPAKDNTSNSAALTLDEAHIIDFARQFDPQPYHLDKTAGLNSIFGDLCASGWQVAALGTRLVGDALTKEGYPFVALTRVEQLRWKRPMFVDEDLIAIVSIVSINPDCRVPGCQTVIVEADLQNSRGDSVAVMRCDAAVDSGDGP